MTETGAVERLGAWSHHERTLRLEAPGFPFLGVGEHRLEGELPWVFWDMCPSGYLGRRLARVLGLGLNSDPRLWSATDCLAVLTEVGEGLPGNLLLGQKSVDRYLRTRDDPSWSLEEVLRETITESARALPSSLGGERPKLSFVADASWWMAKLSPPINDTLGRRWSDLLAIEGLCARTLAQHGLNAVEAEVATKNYGRLGERTMLFVKRYDRRGLRGRVGTGALYWLSMERFGGVSVSAPEVARRLVERGELDQPSADAIDLVHAFSAAIGNTDAHLGNYGLLFDDSGRARVAPFYDVLPMALAPRHDELPDAFLSPTPWVARADVEPLVRTLATLVQESLQVSEPTKTLWLRRVGR